MAVGDERYLAVTTFTGSGEAVSTPTRVVPLSDGRLGCWTATGAGTTTRLRDDPRVRVRACDARGRPRPGAPDLAGTAEVVRSGRLFDEVRAEVRAKYGRLAGVSRRLAELRARLPGRRRAGSAGGDTVVLVRLDG